MKRTSIIGFCLMVAASTFAYANEPDTLPNMEHVIKAQEVPFSIEKHMIEEFDDECGGPVWYIP